MTRLHRRFALLGLVFAAGCSPPEVIDPTPPALEPGVDLVFSVRGDTVRFLAAGTGVTLRTFLPDESSFVRGALPAISRLRTSRGIDGELPWRFGIDPDGRALLLDPETGYLVDLAAFGRSSLDDFDGLLDTAVAGAGP